MKDKIKKLYIEENRSIKDICNELQISKTTFYRLRKKYNIYKEKKYLDRDWLYKKYIVENLSANKIAELCDVSKHPILDALHNFNIAKSEEIVLQNKKDNCIFSTEDFKKRRVEALIKRFGPDYSKSKKIREKYRNTMKKRYGVESAFQNPDLYRKFKNTMINRYGTTTPLKNTGVLKKYRHTMKEKYRVDIIKDNLSDKVHTRTFNGMTLKELAEDKGIGYTTLTQYLRNKDTVSEKEILNFIDSIKNCQTSLEIKFSELSNLEFFNKKIGNYRPDFKINDNVYINVDGLYWHSELNLDKWYHFNLRKAFEEQNFRIYQFREDEVFDPIKSKIIKSMLDNENKIIKNKIGARKTVIISVDQKIADDFLNTSHLMGSIKARHIALKYDDEIVSLMSYKISNKSIKIERFCSKVGYIVQGALTKLLSYIENQYPNHKIEYWVDLRYGTGYNLKRLGFSHKKDTLGWKWTNYRETYNRLRCRANMDERGLSEKEYAEELGWVKIYDAGQRLYVKE